MRGTINRGSDCKCARPRPLQSTIRLHRSRQGADGARSAGRRWSLWSSDRELGQNGPTRLRPRRSSAVGQIQRHYAGARRGSEDAVACITSATNGASNDQFGAVHVGLTFVGCEHWQRNVRRHDRVRSLAATYCHGNRCQNGANLASRRVAPGRQD